MKAAGFSRGIWQAGFLLFVSVFESNAHTRSHSKRQLEWHICRHAHTEMSMQFKDKYSHAQSATLLHVQKIHTHAYTPLQYTYMIFRTHPLAWAAPLPFADSAAAGFSNGAVRCGSGSCSINEPVCLMKRTQSVWLGGDGTTNSCCHHCWGITLLYQLPSLIHHTHPHAHAVAHRRIHPHLQATVIEVEP